jgi:ABC-type transport system involved in multi-copper enzyme maturation permease subunit
MMRACKAEFYKLLSVRSTYFITAFIAAFVIFLGFYLEGWRLNSAGLHDPNQMAGATGAMALTMLGGIVAILLMTHEYRWNTIMYTLPNSNSRSKVLFSKIIVVSAYALFLTALIGILGPVMAYLGIHAHGHVLVPQTLHYWNLIWRSLFFAWGYGIAGLLLAVLLRSQVASIATLLLIPTLVEQLLGGLLLKHNAVYMPFSALSQVLNGSSPGATSSTMSSVKAAGVYCIYLIVGWVVAWILFLKRDAG